MDWRTGIEQLIHRVEEEVTITFENYPGQRTDIRTNIELTDEETSALKCFCWHTSLIKGKLEIEPKTRSITLNGEIDRVIFQF